MSINNESLSSHTGLTLSNVANKRAVNDVEI